MEEVTQANINIAFLLVFCAWQSCILAYFDAPCLPQNMWHLLVWKPLNTTDNVLDGVFLFLGVHFNRCPLLFSSKKLGEEVVEEGKMRDGTDTLIWAGLNCN